MRWFRRKPVEWPDDAPEHWAAAVATLEANVAYARAHPPTSHRSHTHMSDICVNCDEPIRLVDGFWCDRTIDNPIADPSFAAMCGNGGPHVVCVKQA